ncbi:hypothetical protein, partial [Undibacterium jejuense]|uniref:hypothetical protein n=1 Tax=Undibacterium jejuense TaxID=1344949 RepID=UPI001C9A3812
MKNAKKNEPPKQLVFSFIGGADGAVKKTHPSTFLTNKIKDLATLLIKGNRKTATNSVTTA